MSLSIDQSVVLCSALMVSIIFAGLLSAFLFATRWK